MPSLRPAGIAALVLLGVTGLPRPGAPQSIRVVYDRVEARPLEGLDDLPASMRDEAPRTDAASLELLVDGTASLLRPLEVDDPATDADARRARMVSSQLRRVSPTRHDHETLHGAWTDLAAGTMVESRDFLGRTFLVTDARREWNWRLTGDQRVYLDRLVLRATTTLDGAEVEAWFTPEVPLPGGPGEFGGLPGLILLVDVDDGRLTWTARELDPAHAGDGAVAPPTDGEPIDRAGYEAVVAEKLAELRAARRRR